MLRSSYSQFKCVLFDLDDTLVDTTKTTLRRLEQASKKFSLEKDIRHLYNLISDPLREEVLAKSGKYSKEFWLEYERLRNTILVNPIGDVRGLFDKLKIREIKKGVLTNNTHSKSLFKLSRCDIYKEDLDGGFFNSENMLYLKPNYRCFDHLSDKDSIVYIGDDGIDYIAAKNARISFFGVTTGLTSKERFINIGLNDYYIFKNIHEIRLGYD